MAVLWVCFDNHAEDGCVWAVREGKRWHRAALIDIHVPMQSVYRGPNARQPRAYFLARGQVTRSGDRLILTPDK